MAAWLHRKAPFRLMPRTRSHSAAEISRQRGHRADPGVVDQDVDAAPFAGRLGHHPAHLLFVADIRLERQSLAARLADLLGGLAGFIQMDVHQDGAGAILGEIRSAISKPMPRARPGNHCDFIHEHMLSLQPQVGLLHKLVHTVEEARAAGAPSTRRWSNVRLRATIVRTTTWSSPPPAADEAPHAEYGAVGQVDDRGEGVDAVNAQVGDRKRAAGQVIGQRPAFGGPLEQLARNRGPAGSGSSWPHRAAPARPGHARYPQQCRCGPTFQ